MWAIARVDLGLERAYFLRMTPREFDAMVERVRLKDRKQRYAAAMVCWMLAEINRDRDKRREAFTPEDFMGEEKADDHSPMSDDEQVRALRMAFGQPKKKKAKK